MLERFDGSSDEKREKETSVLVEALLGKRIPEDKATSRGMGDLPGSQKTVQFIEKRLFKNSMGIDELVEAYKTEVRPSSGIDECWLELRAAFLAGRMPESGAHMLSISGSCFAFTLGFADSLLYLTFASFSSIRPISLLIFL
jgi:hypothetical protein